MNFDSHDFITEVVMSEHKGTAGHDPAVLSRVSRFVLCILTDTRMPNDFEKVFGSINDAHRAGDIKEVRHKAVKELVSVDGFHFSPRTFQFLTELVQWAAALLRYIPVLNDKVTATQLVMFLKEENITVGTSKYLYSKSENMEAYHVRWQKEGNGGAELSMEITAYEEHTMRDIKTLSWEAGGCLYTIFNKLLDGLRKRGPPRNNIGKDNFVRVANNNDFAKQTQNMENTGIAILNTPQSDAETAIEDIILQYLSSFKFHTKKWLTDQEVRSTATVMGKLCKILNVKPSSFKLHEEMIIERFCLLCERHPPRACNKIQQSKGILRCATAGGTDKPHKNCATAGGTDKAKKRAASAPAPGARKGKEPNVYGFNVPLAGDVQELLDLSYVIQDSQPPPPQDEIPMEFSDDGDDVDTWDYMSNSKLSSECQKHPTPAKPAFDLKKHLERLDYEKLRKDGAYPLGIQRWIHSEHYEALLRDFKGIPANKMTTITNGKHEDVKDYFWNLWRDDITAKLYEKGNAPTQRTGLASKESPFAMHVHPPKFPKANMAKYYL